MAFDAFLKLDGVVGESADAQHKGEIDVHSFSWGLNQAGGSPGGGGGGAGKVTFQDFHFTSRVNKASPVIALKCATGEHIKSATLSVRRAAAGRARGQEFLKFELQDVLVTSYADAGVADEDAPTEAVSLNFTKIQFSYAPQDPSGKVGGWVTMGWDVKQNRKV